MGSARVGRTTAGRRRSSAATMIAKLERDARRGGWCEAVTMMETAVLAGDDPVATLAALTRARDRMIDPSEGDNDA